jgi:hypothetical protein
MNLAAVTRSADHIIDWGTFALSTAGKMAAVAAAPELEEAINRSQAAVQQQGDIVRSLKANVKDGKAQQVQCFACSFGFSVAAALISLLRRGELQSAGRG